MTAKFALSAKEPSWAWEESLTQYYLTLESARTGYNKLIQQDGRFRCIQLHEIKADGEWVLLDEINLGLQEISNLSAVVVKTLVGGYSGKERYSIRKYPNGSFRAFHDNLYEEIGPDSNDDSVPLTGLHADIESVEAELARLGLIQNST